MGNKGTTLNRSGWLVLALLGLSTIAVYLPVLDFGFYNYDDDVYVTANPHVQQGISAESLRWAWTADRGSNWHPLTWMSHMLDWQLFGQSAPYHHLTSLLLHTLSVLLLFVILIQTTGALWESGFVAAVFALHPLHCESVVWIAERKDVLSGLFWMTTIFAYTWYARRPSRLRMLAVIISFAAGLTAKPMLVSLPLVLLLLDLWPLRRAGAEETRAGKDELRTSPPLAGPGRVPFKNLILEKIPLLLLSAASSAVTFLVQTGGGSTRFGSAIPLSDRLANGVISYVRYIGKSFVPVDLSIFYPYPTSPYPRWEILAAILIFGGATCAAILLRKRHPCFLVGWAWFVITLIPVIGIVQVGWQSMADRYMYLPLIGLAIIVAWGVSRMRERIRGLRVPGLALLILPVPVLAVCTRGELAHWHDSVSLFRHAISVTKDNWIACNSLGAALGEKGNTEEALGFLREAVRIRPDYVEAQRNLGVLYVAKHDFIKSTEHFGKALKLQPGYPGLEYDIGYSYYRLGLRDSARLHLEKARAIDSTDIRVLWIVGSMLEQEGKYEEAGRHFSAMLRIRPDFSQAASALARVNGKSKSANSKSAQ